MVKRSKEISLPEPATLSLDAILEVAEGFKTDLQGKANRFVRRHNTAGALAALESIEYVDQFVYALQLRRRSQLHNVLRPPRARNIHIPENLT